MKIIHKISLFLMILSLVLTGCTSQKSTSRLGVADDDVLSLTEVDEDKIVLTMRTGDGMDVERIVNVIETKFPNVQIIVKHNAFTMSDIAHDNIQDIVLSGHPNEFRTAPQGTYIDLASYDFVSQYYLAALNNCEMDGHLYYLPGPSTVTGIVYDKELFEKNGWKPATSLDEFIALCQKIEATGIRALQPTVQFDSAARLLYSGFTYADTFAGTDGYQWLNDYKTGKSHMVGYMEKGFETMKKLLDAGIWRESDFDVTPKQRSHMLYRDHTTAMIIETQMAPNYAKANGEGKEHEIAMMPFFSGNGANDNYLIADPNFYIGLNSHLQDKGNEERFKAATDIVEYISSVEGQKAIISEETPLISNVIGAKTDKSDFLSGVQNTITDGRVVNTVYYWGNQNSEIDTVFCKGLRDYAKGKVSVNDILSLCDQTRDKLLNEPVKTGKVIGKASQDFTVMETALYFADVFAQKGEAQIGFCFANARDNGINAKIYKGDISTDADDSIGTYLQKYFNADKKNKTLKVVTMTGQNIKKALSDSVGSRGSYKDSYLVASGLKIEFAPWATKGKNIVSVKLEDGSELKDNDTYSVAIWSGTIDDQYISEIKQEYTESFTDIFLEALKKANGTIQPFDDQRFVLNWDITASENSTK